MGDYTSLFGSTAYVPGLWGRELRCERAMEHLLDSVPPRKSRCFNGIGAEIDKRFMSEISTALWKQFLRVNKIAVPPLFFSTAYAVLIPYTEDFAKTTLSYRPWAQNTK